MTSFRLPKDVAIKGAGLGVLLARTAPPTSIR
jgi:hypothetical protein